MSLTGRISTITPQSHHHPSTISATTFLPLRRTNTVSFRPSTTFLNPIKIATIVTRNHTPRKATAIKMSMEAGVGLMGTKLGMMTYFEPTGKVVPVTVIGFREGNVVTQVKTEETDGYNAVQVGYRRVRDKKLTKPEMGHLEKAGVIPLRHLQEFRLQSVDGFEANQKLVLEELFKEGDLVDVSGTTIGKGFQGIFFSFCFKIGMIWGYLEVRGLFGICLFSLFWKGEYFYTHPNIFTRLNPDLMVDGSSRILQAKDHFVGYWKRVSSLNLFSSLFTFVLGAFGIAYFKVL